MKYKFKNSSKSDFAINLLLVLISAMLIFIAMKMLSNKISIVVYALAIAITYCRIAVEAIEKLIGGKVHSSLISTVAVLIIFASQEFMAAAVVAVVYSLSKAVFDLICSCFSDKLLEDEECKLYYNVVNGDEIKQVSAKELSQGDVIKAVRGEHLAFDYVYENEKGKKNYKAGKFNLADEGEVTYLSAFPYEIDFEESKTLEPSKAERATALITKVYTIAAVVIAVIMFILKMAKGLPFMDALYVLGMYLLFANPLSINSGVVMAGLFSLKNMKQNGISLENTSDVEKLSRVKKVYFTKDAVVENETHINESVVKTIKIADVLGIETELLNEGDEKETEVIAVGAGFNQYQSCCNSDKTDAVIAEQVIKGAVAYIGEEKEDTMNILSVNGKIACKKAFPELIKGIKSSKIYKWFSFARAAVGAFINFVVIAFYASGIGDKILSEKLVEAEGMDSVDSVSLKTKLLKCLLCNDMLAPWLICGIHLVVINLLLLVTVGFLNNNKKLR